MAIVSTFMPFYITRGYDEHYHERQAIRSRIWQLEKFVTESELTLMKSPNRRQLKLDVMKAQKELIELRNKQ